MKKEHDTDNFVSDEAKYKVIAIENEAPDFIKEELVSKGVVSRELVGAGSGSIFILVEVIHFLTEAMLI